LLLAGYVLQKYTIFAGGILDYRCSQPDSPQEFMSQLTGRHLEKIRYEFNLRPCNPDIALSRPRAASAAPVAFKIQAVNIPFFTQVLYFATFSY
jgi:hypothetical protein